MNMDIEFLNRAKSIRESIEINKTATVNLQNTVIGSKYNKDKVVAKCEICQLANACDVHHINQQCDANSCDLIENVECGIFNKNKLWNLVSLCKSCHQSIHSSPPRIKVNGYNATSTGIELDFTYIDNPNSNPNLCTKDNVMDNVVDNVMDNVGVVAGGNSNNVMASDASDSGDIVHNANKSNKSNKSNKNNKVLGSKKISLELNSLSEEYRKVILEKKKNNDTPKKIQFDMKRHYSLEISQQAIREL
jgi:ribosomal protein S17